MKTIFILSIMGLLYFPAICAVSHITYSPPSGYGCIYDGVGRGYDGTVYVGIGNHTDNCILVKWLPANPCRPEPMSCVLKMIKIHRL